MTTKFLNVTREESAKVVIDFEVNHFAAYLVLSNGSPIIFATEYDWSNMRNRDELSKYRDQWKLPVECSKAACAARTRQL